MNPSDDRFTSWIATLEAKHLAVLTFPEVSRALRALSSAYVERRQKLAEGAALSGAGKRAAFALFYGPLHYLLVAHIVQQLPAATANIATLVDLGCGTGSSGAAWAGACEKPPRVLGIDRHPWPIGEAAATYRAFHLTASVRQGDIANVGLPPGPVSILAAFTLNELPDGERDDAAHAAGRSGGPRRSRVDRRAARRFRGALVEPLARQVRGRRRPCRRVAPADGASADRGQARSRGRSESPRNNRAIVMARAGLKACTTSCANTRRSMCPSLGRE